MRGLHANSFKGRDVSAGQRVSVHRNLNANSLTIKVGSLVHAHAQIVSLLDVDFTVGVKGNEKVNNTKQKHVHAHVNGTIVSASDVNDVEFMYNKLEQDGYTRVYYNPYKVKTFVDYNTLQPIHKATYAHVIMDRVYVK